VSRRERIDYSLQEIVAGVSIEVTVGLGEGHEFRCAAEGIEGQGTVLFGEAEILGNFRRQGSAIGFLFE
jgi:hypothetical protein